MTVIRPEFLRVLPADLCHGYAGAVVLALMRYVTALPGTHNGRREIDGEKWWYTSHADIAKSLDGHVSHDSVRRTLKKLESVGALESRYVAADDHTKMYRPAELSDQSRRENASPATSDDAISPDPDAISPDPDAISPDPDAISPDPLRENAFSSSPSEELKEELVEGGEVPPPALRLASMDEPELSGIVPPSRLCKRHHGDGNPDDDACHGCRRARQYRDDTWPSTPEGFRYAKAQATIAAMAKRQGRQDAPAASLAMQAGRSLDEHKTRVNRLFDRANGGAT